MKAIEKNKVDFRTHFGISRFNVPIEVLPIAFEILPRIGFYTGEHHTWIHIGWLCFHARFTWVKYKVIRYLDD